MLITAFLIGSGDSKWLKEYMFKSITAIDKKQKKSDNKKWIIASM